MQSQLLEQLGDPKGGTCSSLAAASTLAAQFPQLCGKQVTSHARRACRLNPFSCFVWKPIGISPEHIKQLTSCHFCFYPVPGHKGILSNVPASSIPTELWEALPCLTFSVFSMLIGWFAFSLAQVQCFLLSWKWRSDGDEMFSDINAKCQKKEGKSVLLQ